MIYRYEPDYLSFKLFFFPYFILFFVTLSYFIFYLTLRYGLAGYLHHGSKSRHAQWDHYRPDGGPSRHGGLVEKPHPGKNEGPTSPAKPDGGQRTEDSSQRRLQEALLLRCALRLPGHFTDHSEDHHPGVPQKRKGPDEHLRRQTRRDCARVQGEGEVQGRGRGETAEAPPPEQRDGEQQEAVRL